MSPRNKFSLSSLASLAAFVLFLGVLALWPTQPVHAEGEPAAAVLTTTVNLATTDTSITVPVVITPTGAYTYSSVSFVLNYMTTCVRIGNVTSDIVLKQSSFTGSYANDADQGKLTVAVWDQTGSQDALASGVLIEIEFALETACLNGTITQTVFSFATSPAVTFGRGDNSGSDTGVGYQGVYTLDINSVPDITSNSFNAAENVSGSRKLGDLTATDPDDSSFTFALATGCSSSFSNDGFSVANSDELWTTRTFDFEIEDTYPVCLQANDGRGGVSAAEIVTVTVTNANDAPTWLELNGATLFDEDPAGTVIGTFATTDQDDGETFTYSFVAGAGDTDNNQFTIDVNSLKAKSGVDYDFDTKSLYKIRVQTSDGEATYERQFTIQIVAKSELSLPGQPDVPNVVADGSTVVAVPILYSARGNSVVTATFEVAYNTACLNYVNMTGLQTGFSHVGSADADDASPVSINIASSTTSLQEGVIGYLNFRGDASCDTGAWRGDWYDLDITAAPTLKAAGDVAVNSIGTDGKLIVVANDERGDCNSDEAINAGDLPAIVIEYFDDGSEEHGTGNSLASNSWLWSPEGVYSGSAIGCDANADRILASGDIGCTARKIFGLTCSTSVAAASATPAIVRAPAAIAASPDASVTLPVTLQSEGNNVSSMAFAVKIDTTQIAFDPTDADEDGVPDAITLNSPDGMLRMAFYDAATGEIQIVLSGMTVPLPVLEDGIVASIQLTGKAATSGALAAVTLEDVSLGDTEGGTLPVAVELVAPEGAWHSLYLPVAIR